MIQKTFDQLKKNSAVTSKNLYDKLKQSKEKKTYENDSFWKAQLDVAGNAKATIRFLPSPDTDEPFVQVFSHGFQNERGKWFINKCPTTKGGACPVCEANKQAWNEGNQDLARARKRQISYFSNILVVDDPAVPSNNGKVFLFKYGTKIHSKLLDAMCPTDVDDTPIDVFNMFDGANFKLKVKKIAGYSNFDTSLFDIKTSPICGGDETQMKQVFDSLHSLAEFLDDKHFKSYDVLQTEFQSVLDNTTNKKSTIEDTTVEDNIEEQLDQMIKAKMDKKKSKQSIDDEDDIPTTFSSQKKFDEDDSVPFDVDDDIDAQLKALIDD